MKIGSFIPEQRRVVLLSKPSVPGRVKTRLAGARIPGRCAPLSLDDTAALHAAFVGDLVEELGASDAAQRPVRCAWVLELAWAVAATDPYPLELVPPEFRESCLSTRQVGADLGERLYRALDGARARAREHSRNGRALVAAVGSDHPTLRAEHVGEGFERLEQGQCDVVLGPALDGGYYLIAMDANVLSPDLFSGIDWSTERVLEQTLERCREQQLRTELLAPQSDVDEQEDLLRLVETLSTEETPVCVRTRGVLAQLLDHQE